MPLFRRRPPEFTAPAGTLPCAARDCANQTAVLCAYSDRRGRNCDMAFCPQHSSKVGGVVYCRRHAATITALGTGIEKGALPEVDNRGPSLVNWIAEELDEPVTALLERNARPGEVVKTDAEVTIIYDQNRRRRFERSWKLFESTGISIKVCIQVAADADDALVDARVGQYVVARGVPPWIARRRAGLEVDDQVDAEQRQLFRQFLVDHIASEVAEQRTADAATADAQIV
jgi:hypothetical protein